jgi:ketosteroid isomerase-like protein
MAQENVEVVRSLFAAFGRGLDAAADYWDPEIDWRAIEGAPDDVGVMHGRAALRRYYEQWYETFDDLRAEPDELTDAGDHVVAAVHVTGRMKESDAEIDMQLWIVYSLRDGKVIRGREYATRQEALEAAGLSE